MEAVLLCDANVDVNKTKLNWVGSSGADLWKEPSTRSRAFFLEVAISQPKARPSASRIRAFLPGGKQEKHSKHTHNADANSWETVGSFVVSLNASPNQLRES